MNKSGNDLDSSWSLGKAQQKEQTQRKSNRKRTKLSKQVESDSSSSDIGVYKKVTVNLHVNDGKIWKDNTKI